MFVLFRNAVRENVRAIESSLTWYFSGWFRCNRLVTTLKISAMVFLSLAFERSSKQNFNHICWSRQIGINSTHVFHHICFIHITIQIFKKRCITHELEVLSGVIAVIILLAVIIWRLPITLDNATFVKNIVQCFKQIEDDGARPRKSARRLEGSSQSSLARRRWAYLTTKIKAGPRTPFNMRHVLDTGMHSRDNRSTSAGAGPLLSVEGNGFSA